MTDDERPDLIAQLAEGLLSLRDRVREVPTEQLQELAADPIATLIALGEQLGVEWQDSLGDLIAYTRDRLTGDYAVDQFGYDPEFTERVFMPAVRFLARKWFRVEVRGIENVPTEGPALLVANHAGALPVDALVLQGIVHDEVGRHPRMLGADLVFKTPISHDVARRTGCTVACPEDAERLLTSGELVSVFPEGFKGLGKLYAERYRLQRFGRGGFVSTAVRAGAPIVPVSIVGSEEIFPLISTAPTLAKALGLPYFPVTPLFPLLGVLGMVPLPSKWIIEFGEALTTDELPPGAAEDPMTVFQITDQVRITIQNRLYRLLEDRPHTFF
ncbi:acyltransferase family protein [Naumannella sp. ID2617S]|uniref:Glycerol acyltransferase n=1 Tax=Enemella dayhoffiae TaxID=2016507 RepID=A0A255H522_9ACTN|nr:lysophospholipid acyltransferase family protein [Enemella dayhoffiae]NNG20791.1 acyltransferase family protein [Naumannella sp. ID2617S]OYO22790.1 glycerol acyltransferase [Enemella dayhoffiae]